MREQEPGRPCVGALIRSARLRRGMSQRELSLMVGRSPAYVSKLESDAIEPSFLAVSEVAVVLALSPLETWVLCRVALIHSHTRLRESQVTAIAEAAG